MAYRACTSHLWHPQEGRYWLGSFKSLTVLFCRRHVSCIAAHCDATSAELVGGNSSNISRGGSILGIPCKHRFHMMFISNKICQRCQLPSGTFNKACVNETTSERSYCTWHSTCTESILSMHVCILCVGYESMHSDSMTD
jgi:hypothetical protein